MDLAVVLRPVDVDSRNLCGFATFSQGFNMPFADSALMVMRCMWTKVFSDNTSDNTSHNTIPTIVPG